MSIVSVMSSNHLILCCPLPSIFPSIRVFSNESVLRIRWPNYWSLSFSIGPSNGYSGLISHRMDRWHIIKSLADQILRANPPEGSPAQSSRFSNPQHPTGSSCRGPTGNTSIYMKCTRTGRGNVNQSSILAGIIPWTQEPGGLQCVGPQRPGHD